MRKEILLLLILMLFSCNKKTEQSVGENKEIEKPYIISKEDRDTKRHIDSINNNKDNKIALPRRGFYGECNLIIANNNVYYYQKRYTPIFCDYGMENYTLPEFLDLQPKDLIKIPKDCIEKIIEENVMSKEKGRQILVMASQNDTINDKDFLKFLYHIKVPTYIIRRTTQEEDIVLHYKKNNLYYYSDSIKWDKKRIKIKNQPQSK